MSKILITGQNSYVGTSFRNYILKESANEYSIEEISVRGDDWKEFDFSNFEVVLHVAGIAHVTTDPKMEDSYYKVNRDLTIEVAKKAKSQGVKQFIFLSSMIVFGRPHNGVVTNTTLPNPENFYGKSKLQAEVGLEELSSNDFNVTILRPPMIYGPGSKGNYQKLSKMSKISPLFPNYVNARSMLFIGNLNLFIKEVIDNKKYGVYHPQNEQYVQTSHLVKQIAFANNHKLRTTKIFNPIIKLVSRPKLQ